VLVGFPGDYSGHLADSLASTVGPTGLSAVATSFDGDFKGYLVSGEVFRRRSCYETRWMSFFGPWAGDYLTDLAGRMVEKVATGSPTFPRPRASTIDAGPRVALAALLATALIVLGGRRPRGVANLARRLGPTSTAMVALAVAVVSASVAGPALVDWAAIGLPIWARYAGFPLGILALARRKRADPMVAALTFSAACFLLSAAWPVALAALRVGLVGLGPAPGGDRADHQS